MHTFKAGRPKIPEILQDICTRHLPEGLTDIGVFVCGPDPLVKDVMKSANAINALKTGELAPCYVHVHSESFQM